MKKTILYIISILFIAVIAEAQVPKELVEKSWVGLSEQAASFTKSGKVQLRQTMKLTLNADNSVYGTSTTRMTLDGINYHCTATVSGTFTRSTWSVYIKDDTQSSSEKLPYDLKWCKGWGTLTFYTNKSYPGYYLLKGDITDDCGGKSLMEFSDRPQ